MTRNQIEYSKAVETRRTNLANEEITRKRDARQHYVNMLNYEETQRANKAREAYNSQSLAQTMRYNYASLENSTC